MSQLPYFTWVHIVQEIAASSFFFFLLFFFPTKFEAINLRWKTWNQLKYTEHFLLHITLSGQVTYWSVSFSTCFIPLYFPHQPTSVLSGPTSLLFLHLCHHFCRSSLQTPAQGSQPLLAACSLSKFRFNDKKFFPKSVFDTLLCTDWGRKICWLFEWKRKKYFPF